MKTVFSVLFALVMSFNVSTIFAQSGWLDVYIPEPISTIAINDTEMAIFGLGQYYVSPVSSSLQWTARILPVNEQVIAAEFVADQLFVLFASENLYALTDGTWDLVLSDILGISQNSNHLFAWSADWIFDYNDGAWQYQVPLPGATYVAGGNTTIVSTDFTMYQGPRPDQLSFLKEFDMNIREIMITAEEYIYVGTVIGNLAAYHVSPINACYAYDHVLTSGSLNSAAEFHGNIYVAGRLGDKGVIFEAHDISHIDWWPEEILQLRASEAGMLALGVDALHLKLGSTTTGQLLTANTEKYKGSLQVVPNPIQSGLRILATQSMEAQLLTLDGRQGDYLYIKEGTNIFDVSNLPAGVYIVSSPHGTTKFLIK